MSHAVATPVIEVTHTRAQVLLAMADLFSKQAGLQSHAPEVRDTIDAIAKAAAEAQQKAQAEAAEAEARLAAAAARVVASQKKPAAKAEPKKKGA